MAEPEPETTPEAEPKSEPSSSGEPESESGFSMGEPLPEWPESRYIWGPAWEIHIYGVATLFLILVFCAAYHAGKLCKRQTFASKRYFMVLNILILIFASVRAIYFFIDAYNFQKILPLVVALIAENLSFPCLGSAYSILLAALLLSTQYRRISARILSWHVLTGIIVFTFTLSLTADIVTVYKLESFTFQTVCRIVYTIWGIVFSVAFLFIFSKLVYEVRISSNRHELTSIQDCQCTSSRVGDVSRPKMPLAVKVSALTSLCFFTISIANICSLALGWDITGAWSWWVHALVIRLAEICMSSTILLVAALPLYRNS